MQKFSEYISEKSKKPVPTDEELEQILKNADKYSGYVTYSSLINSNNRGFNLSDRATNDKIKAYWEKNINKGHFKPGDKGYL